MMIVLIVLFDLCYCVVFLLDFVVLCVFVGVVVLCFVVV